MDFLRTTLAIGFLFAFGSLSSARQGAAQIGIGWPDPPPDPLLGNHSCDTAFDLVPGIYEELSVVASQPDYYNLRVPPNETLRLTLNVRHLSHDFTVQVRESCNGNVVFHHADFVGTVPIEIENLTPIQQSYVLHLFRDVGYIATEVTIGYDLRVSEHAHGEYPDFCSGDGTISNCPCGNLSYSRAGCLHSGGVGALLIVGGSQFEELGGMHVSAMNLPHNKPAVLFSSNIVSGPVLWPMGDGLLCHTGGMVIRHGARVSTATGAADWSAAFDPALGRQPFEQVLLQVWFRDPNGACGNGSSFTQAVRMRVKPQQTPQ